jgi:hypothetical protein
MHRTRVVFGLTALFLTIGLVVVAAQGHGNAPKVKHQTSVAPAAKASSVKSVPKAARPATAQPKAAQPKTTTVAPVAKAHAAKPVKPASSTSPAAVKASTTKPAKAVKPADTKVAKLKKTEATKGAKTSKSAAAPAKATATVPATTTVSTTPLTPVQQKLQKNTNLAAKLTSRLPAGTDLMAASAGFRNLGQFVAAVNVSNNLGLSFTQLKAKIVTGEMSLGQAIQAVRPLTASATIEAQRAEYDARGMIAESELTPQAPAATTPTSSKSKAKAKTPTR